MLLTPCFLSWNTDTCIQFRFCILLFYIKFSQSLLYLGAGISDFFIRGQVFLDVRFYVTASDKTAAKG